jgi:hypothetical protein
MAPMSALLLAVLLQRSLYVWDEAERIAKGGPPDALLRFCAEKKVGRLYFMYAGKDVAGVRDFVKAAHAAKLEVHAMDPGFLADWIDPFPKAVDHKVLVDWARGAAGLGIFDGLHLDLEPHGHEAWPKHKAELGRFYLDTLRRVREAAGKLPLTAAVPWNWDAVDVDGRPLIHAVQDRLDGVSIMAYRGANAASVIAAIEGEVAYKPGGVELILETDRTVAEEGVPLHVGTEARMEAVFAAARERFGPRLREAVHHYSAWRTLPK